MKKFLITKLLVIFIFISFFFFLILTILTIFGYSIASENIAKNIIEVRKQSYLENNNLYSDKYRELLDKYLFDYGYVSMERIIWYLQVTYNTDDPNTLADEKWEDAYIKNANKENKQMIPTSDMCRYVSSDNYEFKENIINLCDESYRTENNLIYTTSYLELPYVFPLKQESLVSITSIVNEKRNVDLGLSDIEQSSVNFHSGWDLSASAETKVYSICDGTILNVAFTQNDNISFNEQSEPKNSTGNYIQIQCNGTNDIVSYHHLYPNSATNEMIVGNEVYKGQLIAKVGTTGQSTGNHLHLGLTTDLGVRLDAFYFINFNESTIYVE